MEGNPMNQRTEPTIEAGDSARVSYSNARKMWEAGEFSDWVDEHGFPITIDGVTYHRWNKLEDALSDDQWDRG